MTSIVPKRLKKPRPDVQYEYTRIEVPSWGCLVDVLNDLGSKGWKMVDKEPKYLSGVFYGYSILFMRSK